MPRWSLLVCAVLLHNVGDTRALLRQGDGLGEAKRNVVSSNSTARRAFGNPKGCGFQVLPDLHADVWGNESRIGDVDFTLVTS